MLNKFTSYQFNVYIITSWYFDNQGYENFDMDYIKHRVQEIVKKSSIFIYMNHDNHFGIGANNIEKYVNSNTLVMKIPNLRLDFDTNSKEEINKIYEKFYQWKPKPTQ